MVGITLWESEDALRESEEAANKLGATPQAQAERKS